MLNSKKRKMVALKVLETSGVDHPAHLEEGWIVMKNANAMEAPVSEETVEVVLEPTLEEAYIERVVELEKALEASNSQLQKMYDDAMDEDEDEDEDEMEKKKDKKMPAFIQAKIDAKEDEDEDEDMMKSLPEPVREMLQKAQNETEFARQELRKERESRRDEEFVQKAAGWSSLTLDAKDLGPALRRLTDIDANLAEQVEKALSAANAQAESASIFEEIGRGSRPDDGSAFAKVEAMAKSAVGNGEFATKEQAIASIVTQNPDLYAKYRAEQR
jgi:hypothetical protein